jgi:hypothetical protein
MAGSPTAPKSRRGRAGRRRAAAGGVASLDSLLTGQQREAVWSHLLAAAEARSARRKVEALNRAVEVYEDAVYDWLAGLLGRAAEGRG